MIAAAWRQQRLVALVACGLVGTLAIWLGVTGTLQENAFTTLQHVAHGPCLVVTGSACAAASSRYFQLTHLSSVSFGLLLAVPALVGLVLGAPVVAREIERKTNRMAWTQSVTRRRWLLVKVGMGSATVVAILGMLAPVVEWWTTATTRVPRIGAGVFGVAGVAPIGYALFAFAVGVAAGALVRRSVWAFALGIPVYAAIRFLVQEEIRPDLISRVSVVTGVSNIPKGRASYSAESPGWLVHGGYVPAGRLSPASGQSWQSGEERIANCAASILRAKPHAQDPWAACINRLHLQWVNQFQPPRHFWPLQGLESGLFVVFTVMFIGIADLAVQRWRT